MMAEERYEYENESPPFLDVGPQKAGIVRACLDALASNNARVTVEGRTSIHVTPGVKPHTFNFDHCHLRIFHVKDKNLLMMIKFDRDRISAAGTVSGYELARGYNLQQSNLDIEEKKYRVQRAKDDNLVRCNDMGVTSDNFFVSEEPSAPWTETSLALRIDSRDCLQFWMKVLITW